MGRKFTGSCVPPGSSLGLKVTQVVDISTLRESIKGKPIKLTKEQLKYITGK